MREMCGGENFSNETKIADIQDLLANGNFCFAKIERNKQNDLKSQ